MSLVNNGSHDREEFPDGRTIQMISGYCRQRRMFRGVES